MKKQSLTYPFKVVHVYGDWLSKCCQTQTKLVRAPEYLFSFENVPFYKTFLTSSPIIYLATFCCLICLIWKLNLPSSRSPSDISRPCVPAAQNMPSACNTLVRRLDICGKTLCRDLAIEHNFVTVSGNSLIAICLVSAIKNVSFDISLWEALPASDNHQHGAIDWCLRYFLNCKCAAL